MATINKMSSFLARRTLQQQQKHHLRCAGGNGIVHRFKSSKVDLEHYESGWNIDDIGEFKHQGGKFTVQTYNKLSPKGLERFPSELYEECKPASETSQPAHALMLRSHKLQESEVDIAVRAIARCGAGTNNIPVAKMTELGIPVFNTPGANANAVKELILCGLFLGSRRVIDGINHMTDLGQQGLAREKVEKDKAMFGGREIAGKKLAVIGLGNIGAAAARDAAALGMHVSGYDPGLSIKTALTLPHEIAITDSISSAVANADYITLNIPYIKGENGTHGIIGKAVLGHIKPDAVVLNFARGELVDSDAMKEFLDSGNGRYVSDFPDDVVWDHKNAIILPHLGASTYEAEDEAAGMAADTIREYLEHGTIRNSVNFPSTNLDEMDYSNEDTIRVTVVNKNVPGMLSKITEIFARHSINIVQQINHSRDSIAYNVVDIDPTTMDNANGESVVTLKDLQRELTMLDGVLSSRILFGSPGIGYARNVDGQYYV